MKDAKEFSLYKAAPGEILVIVSPLSLFERLLYPLLNHKKLKTLKTLIYL